MCGRSAPSVSAARSPFRGVGVLPMAARRAGATKASGFGKDMSTYSFEEYTQVKHVMSALSPQPRKDWHDVIFTSAPEEHDGGDSRIMTA